MFRRAVVHDDAAGAGAIYGCLFDLLQTARSHTEHRRDGYAWKRMVTYLEKELDDIQEAARTIRLPFKQRSSRRFTLYNQMRKSN